MMAGQQRRPGTPEEQTTAKSMLQQSECRAPERPVRPRQGGDGPFSALTLNGQGKVVGAAATTDLTKG